ncbi:MAG: serine/threonine protein kinase [Blastocatellia bacterium]|nr:serine/threonine protein kinase [Blastocatellia bacterium]
MLNSQFLMSQLPDASQLEALLESAQLLHASLNLEELLRHLLRVVMGRFLVGRALLAVAEDDGLRVALARGLNSFAPGMRFVEAEVQAAGIEHLVPIGDPDNPIGMLGISLPPHGAVTPQDQQFLSALLGIAAGSISNAKAHRETRRLNEQLNQKVQDLQALLDFVRGLTGAPEPDDVVRLLALTLAGRWTVSRYAVVAWKDGQLGVLRQKGMKVVNFLNFADLLAGLPEAIPVAGLPAGALKEHLSDQQGVLLFPLRVTSTAGVCVRGAVVLGPRLGGMDYSPSDLEFGAGMTAQATVALENAWYVRETMARQKQHIMEAAQKQTDLVFSILADTLAGMVLDDKYQLVQKIDSGGFGAIYQGIHLALNRPVAVKVFRPTAFHTTPEELERFWREGVAACRVQHPNSVLVIDSAIARSGIAYLVMELLNGHSLAEEIRRQRILTPRRCAEILLPVCDMLATAHEAGIVHRDIKPDNIFLHSGETGEVVKVVDFGIAKLMDDAYGENFEALTATGCFVGTPSYVAPERLSRSAYDGKADVYSIGIMLYQLLCGRLPFVAFPGETVLSILLQHLHNSPPAPAEVNPYLPASIVEVIMRALEKDPADRPTARELGGLLEQFFQIDIPLPELPDVAEATQEVPTRTMKRPKILETQAATDELALPEAG